MTSCMRDIEKRVFLSVFVSLILVTPRIAFSEPKGKSVADFEVCLEGSDEARVCSSKELSNVVVQCDNGDGTSYFFKYDDLDDLEGSSAYEEVFQCPEGENILAVFVKSGSAKYTGDPIAGLPSGSGAVWSPQACPVDCPVPNLEEEEEEEEETEEPEVPAEETLR